MTKHKAASWKARAERGGDSARQTEIARRKRIMDTTTEAAVLGDLRLSPIEYRDPRELKPSPYNNTFQPLKDEAYWTNLRRDIDEAGAITDPLLIFPDGEIASGHSRQRVALDLLDDGHREFEKIPVRVILSKLTEADKRKRVYLGNLSRFEIDPDTRLCLYATIYPDYFEGTGPQSRPKKGDTVSPIRSEVAETMRVSDRQLKRERAIYQTAKTQATAKGKESPDVADIGAARKAKNTARRKHRTDTVSVSLGPDKHEKNRQPYGSAATSHRQQFDLLRKQIEAAFVASMKKVNATEKPLVFLAGIESVARELQRTVSMRKTLDLIKEHRKNHGGQ